MQWGWIDQVTDPLEGKVKFERRHSGEILTITDPNNHKIRFALNEVGLVSSTTFEGGFTQTRKYDNENNLIEYTDENGLKAIIIRNDNYEITQVNYSNGSFYTFERDENGLITSATNENGTVNIQRDALGQINSSTDVYGNTVQNVYDELGLRTAIIYPNSKTVRTTFNQVGLPVKIEDWLGNYQIRTYNANGYLTKISNSDSSSVDIRYDKLNRPKEQIHYNAQNEIFAHFNIFYSKNGSVEHIAPIDLPLDPAFGEVLENYKYGGDDRLIEVNNMLYESSANGAITSASQDGETKEAYEWIEDDLLSTVLNKQDTIHYIYNALHHRIRKEKNGIEIRYILDIASRLPHVLQEQDNEGEAQASYVYTSGELAWMIGKNNEAEFFHFSPTGHTIALTKKGKISNKYSADIYGDFANHQGESLQPFQWFGKFGIQYEGQGKYYNLNRYYDAPTGRFISKDPYPASITNPQSFNRYIYGYNAPLDYFDPDGLKAQDIMNYKNQGITFDWSKLNDFSAQDYLNYHWSIWERFYEGLTVIPNIISSTPEYEFITSSSTCNYGNLRPDKDGFITLSEANCWYRNGNGETLYADLSKIDLQSIDVSDFNQNENYSYFNIQLYDLDAGLVYGNIGLQYHEDGYVTSTQDIYDFEMREWNSWTNVARNIATLFGSAVAGSGQEYKIILYGTGKID